MMRTVEVTIVILILAVAFIAASFFAVLPSPRQISSLSLRQLAHTTLQVLDTNRGLSSVVFKNVSNSAWKDLEIGLSASLPPNIVYNFTVYDMIRSGDILTQRRVHSLSNSESGLGATSEAAMYLTTSTNVTFTSSPQKISKTLYIINCSDADGWWITGYTARSLAGDLYSMLSPYFTVTVTVQNTTDLGRLLNGIRISGNANENVEGAVIINTFGESAPIPTEYCEGGTRENEGYDPTAAYPYARYFYTVGEKTRLYNWTWVSVVGYPLYYVSNKIVFANEQNSWGIYGMVMVSKAGINAFLQGLDNQAYTYDDTHIAGSPGPVQFSPEGLYWSNYYGVFPASNQTSTRALSSSILSSYDLNVADNLVFKQVGNWIAGGTFSHSEGGALTAIGLTRTPDIRVSALALLMYYQPAIYNSEFGFTGGENPTQRLVVLHLSQQGGS